MPAIRLTQKHVDSARWAGRTEYIRDAHTTGLIVTINKESVVWKVRCDRRDGQRVRTLGTREELPLPDRRPCPGRCRPVEAERRPPAPGRRPSCEPSGLDAAARVGRLRAAPDGRVSNRPALSPPREGTQRARCIALILSPEGASYDEIVAVVLAHSKEGNVAQRMRDIIGLAHKAHGYGVRTSEDGERIFAIN